MKYLSAWLILIIMFAPLAQADDFVPADEDDIAVGANIFVLDADDTGGNITLQFGEVLGEYLRWDDTNSRFTLSGDLDLASAQLINTRFENLAAAPTCNAVASGRVYYDTVQSSAFVCDGTTWIDLGKTSTVPTEDLPVLRVRDTSTTNLNAVATDNLVPWDVQDFSDDKFVHDTVTNNSRIKVTESAKYLVSGSVNLYSTSVRYNGILKFRVNGASVLPQTFQPGYIRNNSNQNETSLVFSTILDLTAGDYFEVLIDRESSTGAATMIANSSSLSVVQLKAAASSSVPPFISSVPAIITPNTTSSIVLTGTGFTPESVVSIPGFPGTINSTTIVSPTQIDLNLTTTGTKATYDVVIDNSGIDNTVWTGNGVDNLEVKQITGTGVAGTYTESFETDLGSWVDSGLDVAWTRDSGGTPSGNTGPTVASDGTFYVFTEASNPNFPGKTFGLETTDFAQAQSISFDYHMYGAAMGTLEIQTLFNGVWTTRQTIAGQQQAAQGDAYLNQFIDLSAYSVESIRFFYTSGTDYTGDCTLDNISIISI